MNTKYLELLFKVKQLADSGVGGEKINARHKLDKLMKKYGVTEDDLYQEEKIHRKFSTLGNSRLFFQTVFSVINNYDGSYIPVSSRYVKIKTTVSEMVEIEYKYKLIYKSYKKELELFFRAFIMKNELYPSEGKSREWSDLTPQEKEDYLKIFGLSSKIEKVQILKALTQCS